MRPLPLASLSAKITAGVVATVLLIGGGSFWILQDFYRKQMIDSLAESTTVQGELIEQSLRYAMHTRSLDLLAEMVSSLASQKGIENVMILNKKGAIRYSSDDEQRGRVLARSDPTCNICHQEGLSVRGRTVVFDAEDGNRVFRNVNPIINSESCMGCHPARDQVNGVLIVDYSMSGIESSLEASSRNIWLSAVTLAVAITAVIVLLMRRMVLQRLRGLVHVVDSIEAGRLDEQADAHGADEISLLSRHLNQMARSLDQSVTNLREREAFLDAVINSADDGIVVVDDRLRVVTANWAYEALRGRDRQELIGTHCNTVELCHLCDEDQCPALATFRTGEVTHRTRSVAGQDGSLRHYEISASPLRNASGRPQVLEAWRDITRRRQIEAQLANSERLASLGLLASGISHEINNPLASITTCLDGLRRRLRASGNRQVPEELPEYLELIRGEVDRCRDLTERLKVLGRKPRQVRQPVDLSAVVRDTLALVRYEAKKNSVRIEENLAADLSPLIAEESQVRQVVLNMVLNAIQAVDGPGWLRVCTSLAPGGLLEIKVADSGRGIEARDLEQIFEPFYSTHQDRRGTGLGLFISKIIVDQMGGSIQVESAPGEGATFTILLPAGPESAGPSAPAATGEESES
jgi:PAS domain S-box-containing protein